MFMKYANIFEEEVKMEKSEKHKWEQCKKMGKEIVNVLSKDFSNGTIDYKMVFLRKRGIKLFGIFLRYEGLIATISVQDRKEYDEPFVYMDGIETLNESRGKGLSTKVLDSLSFLTKSNFFKHLNVKDMSGGFWTKMMERYDFIRDKYTTGFEAG